MSYCESGLQLCLAWGLGLGQLGTRLQQILGLLPVEDSKRVDGMSKAPGPLRCWGTSLLSFLLSQQIPRLTGS